MSDGDSLKVTESGQDCTWKVAGLNWICSPAAEMDRKTVGFFLFSKISQCNPIQFNSIHYSVWWHNNIWITSVPLPEPHSPRLYPHIDTSHSNMPDCFNQRPLIITWEIDENVEKPLQC